ncbi:hypothetical protein K3495_g15287 [Podosphaera aphanis]|nr:hypothetical protein K3495_g15287 [Podosphaera aphanis]
MFQSMHRDTSKVVLSQGVPLAKWKSCLQAKLAKNNVIGHVFHNFPGIRPILRPADTTAEMSPEDPDFSTALDEHLRALEIWTLGEISAKNIIISRLDPSMCPRSYDQMTALELYNSIADTRKETATAPYARALETFLRTRFVNTADDYINRFQVHLQCLNEAAESLHAATGTEYHVTKGQAAAVFVLGTKHVPWLGTWRDLRACNDNNSYTSLETMMSTLRVVDGHRTTTAVETNHAMAAQGSNVANDPDAECKRCKHRHLNRECFKQHPELAVGPVGERYLARKAIGKGKGKGKSNVISVANPCIDSDSESEDGVAVAASASSSSNTRFANYDTGASHHFVPCESMFRDIFTRHKPIKFDQAVGKTSLTRQGTARIVIGSTTLDLHDCLYSPNSSCIIISAGRLQRLGSITPDDNMTTLARRTPQGQCIPIARLIRKNDVQSL